MRQPFLLFVLKSKPTHCSQRNSNSKQQKKNQKKNNFLHKHWYYHTTSILHSQSNGNICTFSTFLGQTASSFAVPITFLQAKLYTKPQTSILLSFSNILKPMYNHPYTMAQADNRLESKCIITHTLCHRLTTDYKIINTQTPAEWVRLWTYHKHKSHWPVYRKWYHVHDSTRTEHQSEHLASAHHGKMQFLENWTQKHNTKHKLSKTKHEQKARKTTQLLKKHTTECDWNQHWSTLV